MSSPGADVPSDDVRQPPAILPSAIRRAILPALAFSVAVPAIMILIEHMDSSHLLQLAILGFDTGLGAMLVATIEMAAARRPPSILRDAVVAVLSLIAGVLVFGLACFQMIYTTTVLSSGGGVARAWAEVGSLLSNIGVQQIGIAFFVVMPVLPVSVARLRRVSLRWQLAFVPMVSLVLAMPVYVRTIKGELDGRAVFFDAAVAGVLVVALALGEKLDHWLVERRARAEASD